MDQVGKIIRHLHFGLQSSLGLHFGLQSSYARVSLYTQEQPSLNVQVPESCSILIQITKLHPCSQKNLTQLAFSEYT